MQTFIQDVCRDGSGTWYTLLGKMPLSVFRPHIPLYSFLPWFLTLPNWPCTSTMCVSKVHISLPVASEVNLF